MKEKFLQFFTGKLSKSIYIAVTSAVVCGAVVIGSAVAVHNHNQEIQTENTASENITETVTESATEGVSVTEGNDTTAPAQPANNEPIGDRALQYLAEYNRITEEYERKRAELDKQSSASNIGVTRSLGPKPVREIFYDRSPSMSDEDVAKIQAELDAEYESRVAAWEEESIAVAEENRIEMQKLAEEEARLDKVHKQLQALEEQYEKDVAALKAQYGIA